VKQNVHQALQYLHAYCARFDEIPQEELNLAVDAIEDCVHAGRLPVQTAAEPLYVTRLLTNCVAKASKMVCSSDRILLSAQPKFKFIFEQEG